MEDFNDQQSTAESFDRKEETGSRIDFDSTITRRKFLQGLGIVVAAAALSSCAPRLSNAEESNNDYDTDPNFTSNILKVNEQFKSRQEGFVSEDGSFKYDQFVSRYPGFEKYVENIDRYSKVMYGMYGIDKNVMKALTSSIIASHIGNLDPIGQNPNVFRERCGIMQFFPENVLKIFRDRGINMPTVDEMREDGTNINIGMEYIVESLKNIQNDGENTDLVDLMLAYYYGGEPLVGLMKWKQDINQDSYLLDNYNRYVKASGIYGLSHKVEQKVSNPDLVHILDQVESIWSESKFGDYRQLFIDQVDEYHSKALLYNPEITKAQLLSVFLSVARAESKGGIYKEIVNPPIDAKKDQLAVGWYQIVPKWKHLEKFNLDKGKNYTYDDMVKNDVASIEVGIWTLMQYSNSMGIVESMEKFKGGWSFGNFVDDHLWWNRVSFGIKQLLGENPFQMEYLDYFFPREIRDEEGNLIQIVWDPYKHYQFEELGHMGVMGHDPKSE